MGACATWSAFSPHMPPPPLTVTASSSYLIIFADTYLIAWSVCVEVKATWAAATAAGGDHHVVQDCPLPDMGLTEEERDLIRRLTAGDGRIESITSESYSFLVDVAGMITLEKGPLWQHLAAVLNLVAPGRLPNWRRTSVFGDGFAMTDQHMSDVLNLLSASKRSVPEAVSNAKEHSGSGAAALAGHGLLAPDSSPLVSEEIDGASLDDIHGDDEHAYVIDRSLIHELQAAAAEEVGSDVGLEAGDDDVVSSTPALSPDDTEEPLILPHDGDVLDAIIYLLAMQYGTEYTLSPGSYSRSSVLPELAERRTMSATAAPDSAPGKKTKRSPSSSHKMKELHAFGETLRFLQVMHTDIHGVCLRARAGSLCRQASSRCQSTLWMLEEAQKKWQERCTVSCRTSRRNSYFCPYSRCD
jgi:hypothetical protein